MRLSKKHSFRASQHRSVFGVMLLVGTVISPSLAQASADMLPSQMRREALKVRSADFHFEASCGVDGMDSLSVHHEDYDADNPDYPPELAKCMIFGNQDQARYICLCADLKDPVTGDIAAGKIPSLDDESDMHPYEQFEDLCNAKFNTACGPFPEPIEMECESARGECSLYAQGNKREGGLNYVTTDCYCDGDELGWSLDQQLKKGVSLDRAQADKLCKAQLASCEGEQKPVIHDFQSQHGSAYNLSRFMCAQESDTRYDACLVKVRDGGAQAEYRCDCSGNYLEGEFPISQEGLASEMASACDDRLRRCEKFEPDMDEDDDWPDDEASEDESQEKSEDTEDTEDTKDSMPSLEDIFEAWGCRAAPGSGFGFQSLLGFGALLLLGGRFRRRRGA